MFIFDNLPWKREHLAKMGSLIEAPALYGNLTGAENLMIHTRLMGIPKEKIHEVLEVVDLLGLFVVVNFCFKE